MKKLIYIFLSIISVTFLACEEVVELDLPVSPPVLVIDAALDWEAGTSGEIQTIKLTTTAPYYDESVPNADGAIVTVNDESGNTFEFIEEPGTGNYICTNFLPKYNEKYTLHITYKDEDYIAEETLAPTVPIDKVEQVDDAGFLQDELGLKIYFTDPGDKDYFYYLESKTSAKPLKDISVFDNDFSKGNQLDVSVSFEDSEIGDVLEVKLLNISKQYYDFMNLLLEQADNGNPFAGNPAGVNGNCYNQTNPENRPLGYFRVTETRNITHVLQ
ncbi:DUF4249 domain-containing protein [Aureivirga sp. CE67]|uniref:DUF4249 domain-containing protein n=1 Tax=Aureivirga sp. CE67 TaxID=1788983 RepID=UPI0018CB459E|nr:DUF4249 domain-containing protein [Aureivirga sp. CE67]